MPPSRLCTRSCRVLCFQALRAKSHGYVGRCYSSGIGPALLLMYTYKSDWSKLPLSRAHAGNPRPARSRTFSHGMRLGDTLQDVYQFDAANTCLLDNCPSPRSSPPGPVRILVCQSYQVAEHKEVLLGSLRWSYTVADDQGLSVVCHHCIEWYKWCSFSDLAAVY